MHSIETLSMDRYRRFLAEAQPVERTLYHDPSWLEAVQEGLGLEPVTLAFLEGGEPVAALPGFMWRRWGARIFGSPLRGSMTPYLGWLTTSRFGLGSREILEETQAYCTRRLGCQYIEIGLLNQPADGLAPGWQHSVRETYMLDLTIGEAALWSNLGQRHRGKIRKAQKSGVTVESVTDRSIMDQLFPMVEAAYSRHQAVSPHPKRFYLAVHDRLVPRDLMQVFVAWYEGRAIAISVVLNDDREARSMSVGSLPEYHHLFPNNLLHWHAIAWATERGIQRYDFGGKGQASIDRFKETFRPSPYAYTFYEGGRPAAVLAKRLVVRAWPAMQWCRFHIRRASRGWSHGSSTPPSLAHSEGQ